MDRFLRALILYIQYFVDIWEFDLHLREAAARKLRQPVCTELENAVRNDLSDVRSMLCREYLSLIGGFEEANKFHHMKESNSLSEKDRRLYETLMSVATRVVWVALQRKHLNLIELEMNRLFRSHFFNIVEHRRPAASLARTPTEDRVLLGASNQHERKLLQRSPLVRELWLGDHDHRMLGVGFKNFEPSDERTRYLEIAYAAPEELLLDLGVTVGILGIPREEYDPILMTRERTSKTYTKPPIEVPPFQIPPRLTNKGDEVPKTFPTEPCKYTETKKTTSDRKKQCRMWMRIIRGTVEGSAIDMQQRKSMGDQLSDVLSLTSQI